LVSFYTGFTREEGGVTEAETTVPDPGNTPHEAASLGQYDTEETETRGHDTSKLR